MSKAYNRCIFAFVMLISLVVHAQTSMVTKETRAHEILLKIKDPSKEHVLVVSHRGDWRYAPENSLPAIQRCIDLGVDIVEIDVRLTKDGHLVAMHDETVDRTTNGKGRVSELTLDEIKTFRLKNACGARGSRIQVPTLEEVMELSKDKIMINLDKVEGKTVREAYEVLKKTGTIDHAIFKGRETAGFMREKYGSLMDSIIYMPMLIRNSDNIPQFIQEYKEDLSPLAYEVTFETESSISFKQIPKMKREGIFVLNIALWDELVAGHTDELFLMEGADVSWGWLIANGADGIMTDRPKELLDYLRKKGLRK